MKDRTGNIRFGEFDLTMQVNAYGPWRVTKAFAPLIIAAKGRIASTSSISGILAGPQITAYVMSKYAVEGFTDSLAAEMEPHGVHVSVVEPGSYKTEIYRSVSKRVAARHPPEDAAGAFPPAVQAPTTNHRDTGSMPRASSTVWRRCER